MTCSREKPLAMSLLITASGNGLAEEEAPEGVEELPNTAPEGPAPNWAEKENQQNLNTIM